jgi:hypothetical protein
MGRSEICRAAAVPWISSCRAGGMSWATANQTTPACVLTSQLTMARVPSRPATSDSATAEKRTVDKNSGSNRVVMVSISS